MAFRSPVLDEEHDELADPLFGEQVTNAHTAEYLGSIYYCLSGPTAESALRQDGREGFALYFFQIVFCVMAYGKRIADAGEVYGKVKRPGVISFAGACG